MTHIEQLQYFKTTGFKLIFHQFKKCLNSNHKGYQVFYFFFNFRDVVDIARSMRLAKCIYGWLICVVIAIQVILQYLISSTQPISFSVLVIYVQMQWGLA